MELLCVCLIALNVSFPKFRFSIHKPNHITAINHSKTNHSIAFILFSPSHLIISQTLKTSLITTSDGAFLEKSSDFKFRFHPSEYK